MSSGESGPVTAEGTVAATLAGWAVHHPDAVALVRTGEDERCFRELVATMAAGWDQLAAVGVAAGDLVLVVASRDADLVLGALVAMWAGVAAPVSSSQPDDYLRQALVDLAPSAVLCPAAERARLAALAPGLPLVVLADRPAPGGSEPQGDPDAVVLVLPTTGSTGRPKWVSLTNRNLAASAAVLERVHGLGPADRALSLSPAGHALGIRTVTDALLLGGSAIVGAGALSGLDAAGSALVEESPTWVVGPPGVLDAVVAGLTRTDRYPAPTLRLARSGAAALSDAARARIEQRLGVPLVAGYAMTEVGKIALQPLPPVPGKEHTVGRPNLELRIVDDAGHPVATGEPGRIVVRGDLVCAGYWGDPSPHTDGDGWFDTGDLGTLDGDGFVGVVGRRDDTINRGGELIDPRAVEAALLRHPAVESALVAGVPHPTLGEAVAALVVARSDQAEPELDDLWRAAAEGIRLTHLPAFVRWVDAVPLGPTGKPDRRGAAAVLAREAPASRRRRTTDLGEVPAVGATTAEVAEIWTELLDLGRPPFEDDDFFHIGGDSLLALELGIRLSALAGVSLPSAVVVEHRTLGEQVRLVASHRLGEPVGSPGLLRLDPGRAGTHVPVPIVLVPGSDATNLSMMRIIGHLGDRRPLYGLELVDGEVPTEAVVTVDAIADRHEQALVAGSLHDVHLVGYSFGSFVAMELAHRLEQAGRPPRSVVLIDAMAPEARAGYRHTPTRWSAVSHRVWGVHRRWEAVGAAADASRRGSGLLDRARRFAASVRAVPGGWMPGGGALAESPAAAARRAVRDERQGSLEHYEPPRVGVPTILVVSTLRAQQCGDPVLGWAQRMPVTQVHRVRASHRSLRYWRAGALARTLHQALDRLEE